MNRFKLFGLLIVLFFQSAKLTAQVDNSAFINNYKINSGDSGKLFFRFENTDFLKNNEYFNDYYEGFTLLGYFVKPVLEFYPNSKTKITAGAFLQKYSGIDGFTQATPLLTFQYAGTSWFDLVIGTIYGSYNHNLIEPLYQSDRYYREQQENGLQLLFNRKHFRADIWASWEKFIFQNDPSQEKIFGGVSGSLILFPENQEHKFSFEIPLQGTVQHLGGQINVSDKKMSTLLNSALGFKTAYRLNNRTSLILDGYFAKFYDNSPEKQLPYIAGYGLLGNLGVKRGNFTLLAGYWNCENFISPKGEPLFQSVSQMDSSYFRKKRKLVTLKLDFNKKISSDISLNFRVESYYDIVVKNLDYSYGLNIIFNRSFFIKKW